MPNHYYIDSDWTIVKFDEPQEGFCEFQPTNGFPTREVDTALRYRLSPEEVTEYLLDPWKFACNNGIIDERCPDDPDDDEAYYEAWRKEIASEDALKDEDIVKKSIRRITNEIQDSI